LVRVPNAVNPILVKRNAGGTADVPILGGAGNVIEVGDFTTASNVVLQSQLSARVLSGTANVGVIVSGASGNITLAAGAPSVIEMTNSLAGGNAIRITPRFNGTTLFQFEATVTGVTFSHLTATGVAGALWTMQSQNSDVSGGDFNITTGQGPSATTNGAFRLAAGTQRVFRTDPVAVESPSTLKISKPLIGDEVNNDTLRFGTVVHDLTGQSGTITLTADEYKNFAIIFTGTPTASSTPTVIISPDQGGWTKVLDFTDTTLGVVSFTLQVGAGGAGQTYVFSGAERATPFCYIATYDGTTLRVRQLVT
jgi:hypothetical protein